LPNSHRTLPIGRYPENFTFHAGKARVLALLDSGRCPSMAMKPYVDTQEGFAVTPPIRWRALHTGLDLQCPAARGAVAAALLIITYAWRAETPMARYFTASPICRVQVLPHVGSNAFEGTWRRTDVRITAAAIDALALTKARSASTARAGR
jgi:hypothetical protein